MLLRDPSYLRKITEMSPLIPRDELQMAAQYTGSTGTGKIGVEEATSNGVAEDEKSLKKSPECLQKACSVLSDRFGVHLLQDWKYVMFMISYSLTLLSHISLHWFIPDRAMEIGFSNHAAAMTLTVVNFSNIFSRLIFGINSSTKLFNHIIVLTLYVFVSGSISISVMFITQFWLYIVFTVLFGLLRGLFVIYVLLIVVDLVGKSQVDRGLGLIFFLAGFVFLATIPVFGHYNEVTHSYEWTFFLYGCIELFGGLFLVTIPVYLCAQRVRKEK